jgi:hypothetical protein
MANGIFAKLGREHRMLELYHNIAVIPYILRLELLKLDVPCGSLNLQWQIGRRAWTTCARGRAKARSDNKRACL